MVITDYLTPNTTAIITTVAIVMRCNLYYWNKFVVLLSYIAMPTVIPSLTLSFIMVLHRNVRHYDDVTMGAKASQITSLTIVYSTFYSGADQSKHQSSASLAFVWGIHRGPVNSPHKWPVTRKMFPFDDVIMVSVNWVIRPDPTRCMPLRVVRCLFLRPGMLIILKYIDHPVWYHCRFGCRYWHKLTDIRA